MKTDSLPAANEEMSPLFELLANTDNGVPLLEAETALQSLVLASRQFGGKGQIVLTISTSTSFGKGTPQTKVVVNVSKKVPSVPLGVSTFFATEDGRLLRDDPAQMEFDLSGKKATPIKVGRRRGEKKAGAEETWSAASGE